MTPPPATLLQALGAWIRRTVAGLEPSEEALREAASQATLQRRDPLEILFSQETQADALYVAEVGSVHLYRTSLDGQEIALRRVGPGEVFGDKALLASAHGRRNASARTVEGGPVWRLGYRAARQLLQAHQGLEEGLGKVRLERLVEAFAAQSAVMGRFPLDALRDQGRHLCLPSGARVFSQGDPADALYLLLSGEVLVLEDRGKGPQPVARLTPGEIFGERGLLQGTPRSATVVAWDAVELLMVSQQRFEAFCGEHPEARLHLQRLQQVYLLPNRGLVTQYASEFEGSACVNSLCPMPDGRNAAASVVLGAAVFHAQVQGASPERHLRYQDPARGQRRALGLQGPRIVELTVEGSWEAQGQAVDQLIAQTPLHPWQLALFTERGELHLEEERWPGDPGEPICTCLQITRGELQRAIQAGADALETLQARTGAGTVCGGCTPRLRELLGRSDWTPVVLESTVEWAPGLRSFRLRPCRGAARPALPGQHLVVQAQIDGQWVQRPYTLTSPPGSERYEITVRRLARGALTTWLFERCRPDSLIRVSSPQGTFCPDLQGPRATVYLVAGIGLTPALAAWRAWPRGPLAPGLHVELSISGDLDRGLAGEFRDPAPGASIRIRDTRREGRLTPEELAGLAARFPEADFLLCGPAGFEAAARQGLEDAGVAPGRIRSEAFTPAAPFAEAGAAPRAPGVAAADAAPPACPRAAAGPAPGAAARPLDLQASERPASREAEARAFLEAYYLEQGLGEVFRVRWQEVEAELASRGTYRQTYEELAHGARLAWRNSTRCVGRLFWRGLTVRDARHLEGEEEIFASLVEHLRLATNGGNLRAVITVLPPADPQTGAGIRIRNPQLLRYAGYRRPDGSILGDPAQLTLTGEALALGWRPAERTAFDLLPLILQRPGHPPRWWEWPREHVLEVKITHPELPWFPELGLRWYAVPAVSEMKLDCGGVEYTAAPFSGWYMGTEIGARNFGDTSRYDLLPEIARRMGLDTRRERSLWRDRALIELNVAVLHSYEQRGVKMLDHHTATRDFLEFEQLERAEGRPVYGDWSWLVPPISGSATPVFHRKWEDRVLKPNFFPQGETDELLAPPQPPG